MRRDVTGTFHIWSGSGENGLYRSFESDNFKKPLRGDAGLDLPMPHTVTIPRKALSYKIGLRVRARCTSAGKTYAYILVPRSSTGSKTPIRLSNQVGIIDKGYDGELCVYVDNISGSDWTVPKGTRLFQLVPIGISFDKLTFKLYATGLFGQHPVYNSIRGDGGFGSTDGVCEDLHNVTI